MYTPVLSTEALKTGKAPVPSRQFQAVAMDIEGCYLTPFKTMVKKYKGTDTATQLFHKKAAQSLRVADNAQAYLSKGLISEARANVATNKAWEFIVNLAKRIR